MGRHTVKILKLGEHVLKNLKSEKTLQYYRLEGTQLKP
jgi:hypothetical protein